MNGIRSFFLYAALASFASGFSIVSTVAQESFQQVNPVDSLQEKLYVHTDKNFYLAGEIIWFKVYCVKAIDNRPVNLSKLAYVEIIDRGGKPILQAKIALGAKGGDGSFYLPLSVISDNYRIRAYTRYMKNEGAGSFFDKSLTIVNTMKSGGSPIKDSSSEINAAFFPEGGQLVSNIESRVAFHLTDQFGKGIQAEGLVLDDKGDTITRFSSHRFGMGTFLLKPVSGSRYTTIVHATGPSSFIRALPAIEEKGYVMGVTDNEDGRWKIRILGKGTDPSIPGEDIVLLASTRKMLKKALNGFLSYDRELTLYIDKNALGEGISQLTLLNKNRQPVCERLVFKQPDSAEKLILHSDKENYASRERVELSALLSSKDDSHLSSYSLAVFEQDSSRPVDDADINSYLWLSSDLRGEVESPGFYFSGDPTVPAAIDELLLTHGWRRFDKPVGDAPELKTTIKVAPEFRAHIISARMVNTVNGSPGRSLICYLSVPSKPFGLYTAVSDSTGMVSFPVNDYYGPGEIIIQTERADGGGYRADILTPFWGNYRPENWSHITMPKNDEDILTGRSIAMQTQNIYHADSTRRFDTPVLVDTLPFFGKAEYSYRLDDYKRFTTMEEVLREYVTPVTVAPHNGKLAMRIYDDINKVLFTNNLLILIDGVPLTDFNQLFNYDPMKVKKLDVVSHQYVLGPANFLGVISAETYLGQFDAFELDPTIVAVDYEGLQLHRQFYAPEYKSVNPQNHLPDLRTTLYWSPNLYPGKDGREMAQFYSSDRKGKFLAVLQGINAEGKPVSATTLFSVQ